MSIEIIVFVFGGILLLIGILGGGFEIRELKIPPVGWVPRLLAAAGGVVFISMGLGMGQDGLAKTVPPARPEREASVDFTIHDRLGEGQVSEQVTILIDGKVVGDLTVDRHHPTSMVKVTVPNAGKYSYTVEAKAVFSLGGRLIPLEGVGQGIVNVSPGKSFNLAGSFSGGTWLVTLVENAR